MKSIVERELELKACPWINKKNGYQYDIDAIAINCTSSRYGNLMVIYNRFGRGKK